MMGFADEGEKRFFVALMDVVFTVRCTECVFLSLLLDYLNTCTLPNESLLIPQHQREGLYS
jgi:hypothetical protein